MAQFSVHSEQDPLGSSYPIPWQTLMEVHAEAYRSNVTKQETCRSPGLRSPNGRYLAYSRIQMQVEPDFLASHAHSILFLEDLQTRDIQTVIPRSPISRHLMNHRRSNAHGHGQIASSQSDVLGAVAMIAPMAWSRQGDRLLVRVFEAVLGSELLSDYAVIWDATSRRIHTLAPTQISHSHAILLGWSQNYPQEVLFQAGIIGDLEWPIWRVNLQGITIASPSDQPCVFGDYGQQWSSLQREQRAAS